MANTPAQAHLRLVSSHGDTPCTPVEPTAERELGIQIVPRGYDCWEGTSAQLVAEGVLPPDVDWPKGLESMSWIAGRFEYWLYRIRPEGCKGPKSAYRDVDYWACRRTLAAQGHDGFAAARLYERTQALTQEIQRQSPKGQQLERRYFATFDDQGYRAFKRLICPPTRKAGRQPKAVQASADKGARHE